MKRINMADLEAAVRVLNQTIGVAQGKPEAFCLQGAYGGWQLQRIHPSGGNESMTTGYRSKRELYDLILSMRTGVVIGLSQPVTI
jgi:hypothetical protein